MSPTAYYGTLLAVGMAAVVVALLCWQWAERRRRGSALSVEDQAHFARQDVRRWLVSGVMTLLGFGVYFGSRIPNRHQGRPNVWFLAVWLGVFLLILVLMVLAMVDWLATRRYAQRHRTSIVREGMEILRDEMRLRSAQRTHLRPGEGSNGPTPD